MVLTMPPIVPGTVKAVPYRQFPFDVPQLMLPLLFLI